MQPLISQLQVLDGLQVIRLLDSTRAQLIVDNTQAYYQHGKDFIQQEEGALGAIDYLDSLGLLGIEGVYLLAQDITNLLVGVNQEYILQQKYLGYLGNINKLYNIVVGLIDTQALGLDPQYYNKGHQGGVELIILLVDSLYYQVANIEGEEYLSKLGLCSYQEGQGLARVGILKSRLPLARIRPLLIRLLRPLQQLIRVQVYKEVLLI